MANQRSFEALMHEVCVERGWCGAVVDGRPMHVTDFLPTRGMVTADQFVNWLMKAEGVDPAEDRAKWQSHAAGLREAFVRHMGSTYVDAWQLAWSSC